MRPIASTLRRGDDPQQIVMPRKTKKPPPAPPKPAGFRNQPFRGLGALVPARPAAPAAPPPPAKPPPEPEPDDLSAFLAAVAGARPLDPQHRRRVAAPTPAAEPRAVTDPEAEALAELCDLVSGSAPFDISDSDEYVEGGVVGVDPRLLRRLRRGEFAFQAHLDLHGMTRDEARPAVEAFVREAWLAGRRCVLLIHGRGRNSKDQIPVLKGAVTGWLARGALSRQVLAFATARPCDGGAGALYVLLRRRRDKQPFVVLNGAGR